MNWGETDKNGDGFLNKEEFIPLYYYVTQGYSAGFNLCTPKYNAILDKAGTEFTNLNNQCYALKETECPSNTQCRWN